MEFMDCISVQVGWFLHTPFPSSEIYRTLPVREEVLRAVLKSDLIGFHTYDYARHFVSACTRILGLEVRTSSHSLLHWDGHQPLNCAISQRMLKPLVFYLRGCMLLGKEFSDKAVCACRELRKGLRIMAP